MTKKIRWSEEEKSILRDMFAGGSNFSEIAQVIGRPASAVSGYAGYLGLRKSPLKKNRKTAGYWREWTREEEAYIRAHYGKVLAASIANHLGRTVPSVRERARRLGVTSTISHIISSALGTERIKHGLRERKIAQTGNSKLDWKRVDVIEWESLHGLVPDGMMLIKPPGKPRIPESLQLINISDFAPVAAYRNAPEEIRKLWHLKSQFSSALAKIEKLNTPSDRYTNLGNTLLRKHEWSTSETEYLLAHHSSITIKEIAAALGRTRASVRCRMQRLRIKAKKRFTWNDERVQLMVSIHQSRSNAEMAKILGCSKCCIKKKRKELGLRRQKEEY